MLREASRGAEGAQKVFDDERLFAVIYGLDEGDDFKDPKMWGKANPNLGVSVSLDYLEAQVGQAIRSPLSRTQSRPSTSIYGLGPRPRGSTWSSGQGLAMNPLKIEDFSDCEAMVGLDLAVRVDIAARVSLFWREIEGRRHYYAIPHFYLPEDAMDTAKNGKTYAGWAAAGHIELMDGAEISLLKIQEDVMAIPSMHAVRGWYMTPGRLRRSLRPSVRRELRR